MNQYLKNKLKIILREIRGNQNYKKLIKKGLKVGKNFDYNTNLIIDESFCWLISIGDNVTFAANIIIFAHDASTKLKLGYTKIGKVIIGNNVFIGAGVIILPGVKIGDNCVIGAGSIVRDSIPDNSLAVGNPAKVVTTYENYIKKNKEKMQSSIIYDRSYTANYNVSNQKKEQMKKELTDNIGYIE